MSSLTAITSTENSNKPPDRVRTSGHIDDPLVGRNIWTWTPDGPGERSDTPRRRTIHAFVYACKMALCQVTVVRINLYRGFSYHVTVKVNW